MPKVKITADTSGANTLLNGMKRLEETLNEPRHLQAMTKSAFEIMEGAFNWDTASIAAMQPESFHHIYEPEHIGEPPFQLFKVRMSGRGGNRVISWDWRASKLTVPTEVGPTGRDRWSGAGPEFDPSRLNRIHVFVWKAPIMEYGTTVTVRPKLSKFLVFPASEVRGTKATPVFTPHSYTFTPGKLVHGNFTSWFARWWGEGMAEQALTGWSKSSGEAFRRSFEQRMAVATRTRGAGRMFSMDTTAAAKGTQVAKLIAGDLRRHYINDAKRRKKEVTDPDE